jgi:hypothetical protein
MLEALGGHTGTGSPARHRQRFANAASVHARRAILTELIHPKNLAATSAVDSPQRPVRVDFGRRGSLTIRPDPATTGRIA